MQPITEVKLHNVNQYQGAPDARMNHAHCKGMDCQEGDR